MIITNAIVFPALDISMKDWKDENVLEIFHYNVFFYSSSENDYIKYAHNHSVVDVKGNVYKITGKASLGRWRAFVPFVAKYKLLYTPQNISMDLEEIREFMIIKIADLPESEEFMEGVKKANSIQELFEGK